MLTFVVQAFRPAAPRAGRAEALHYVSGAATIEAPYGDSRGPSSPRSGGPKRTALHFVKHIL